MTENEKAKELIATSETTVKVNPQNGWYLKRFAALQFEGSVDNFSTNMPIHVLEQQLPKDDTMKLDDAVIEGQDFDYSKFYDERGNEYSSVSELVQTLLDLDDDDSIQEYNEENPDLPYIPYEKLREMDKKDIPELLLSVADEADYVDAYKEVSDIESWNVEVTPIFDKVRNGVHIETYNSKLQELLKKPVNVDVLTAHLMLRPGVFARYLDFALRNCSDEHQMEDVLFRFISVCKNVSPRVLVQLINHFRNRNNPVQLATGKANGAGSAALDREVEPISDVMCNRVARDIFNQLWQVLRAEDTEPKSIYIDPACHCNKLIFPDNPRQISSAMRATACGSRTQLPDGNVLRAFLYWKGDDGTDLWDGIDLDLSVVFYGEKEANFVFYGEPKNERLGAIHSGDRRCSGLHGAVEYVDFDIKKCLQNGIRYAALVVNSYSGEKFSEMDAAFCGVMVRDGETGEQFEPATVKDRFALTTDAGQIIMVVIDLLNREVVTVDKSIAQVRVACRNVVTDYAPTVDICSYAMQLKSLSIKEMLGMRYAKFLKDNEWEQASVIVSDEPGKFRQTKEGVPAPRVVSPYDIPGIYDIVFGTESK